GPFRDAAQLNYALGQKVDVLERCVMQLVEQLVERDELGTFHVPMRLFRLLLEVDRVRQPLVQEVDHLTACRLRDVVECRVGGAGYGKTPCLVEVWVVFNRAAAGAAAGSRSRRRSGRCRPGSPRRARVAGRRSAGRRGASCASRQPSGPHRALRPRARTAPPPRAGWRGRPNPRPRSPRCRAAAAGRPPRRPPRLAPRRGGGPAGVPSPRICPCASSVPKRQPCPAGSHTLSRLKRSLRLAKERPLEQAPLAR